MERIGRFFPVLLERYQQFIKEKGLADNRQDYRFFFNHVLRDGKQILQHTAIPGIEGQIRMQINFGISTGINGIPTAITIQRGNTLRIKKHNGRGC